MLHEQAGLRLALQVIYKVSLMTRPDGSQVQLQQFYKPQPRHCTHLAGGVLHLQAETVQPQEDLTCLYAS